MVFSSVPLYLDPPNWQQQHPNHQQLQGNGTANHEINQHHLSSIIPPPPLPQPPPHHQVVGGLGGGGGGGGGTGAGSPPIRPNSMAERARLAKIPPPEAPLKCPRCESTNTKFCYFNNYSLTQPRHFCKTCRRYWTRGGALRNVPVGGGCRRNKRSSGGSKSSSSTSSASASAATTSSKSLSSSSLSAAMGPAIASGGFMASLQSIAQLGIAGNLGLSFGGSTNGLHSSNPVVLDHLDHYGSTTTSTNLNSLLNHHHHSFPNFLGGFEIPGSSTTSFQNVVVSGSDDDQVIGKGMTTTSIPNLSSIMGVKMEDGLNVEKGLLMGISTSELNNATSSTTANNGQFWGGVNANNMWSSTTTHLPGLNSSSTATTSNLM